MGTYVGGGLIIELDARNVFDRGPVAARHLSDCVCLRDGPEVLAQKPESFSRFTSKAADTPISFELDFIEPLLALRQFVCGKTFHWFDECGASFWKSVQFLACVAGHLSAISGDSDHPMLLSNQT